MKRQSYLIWLLLSVFLLSAQETSYSQSAFWQQVNVLPGNVVTSIAINAGGEIFAGAFDGGIIRSTDNGLSWVRSNTGLTDTEVFSVVASPNGYVLQGLSAEAYSGPQTMAKLGHRPIAA